MNFSRLLVTHFIVFLAVVTGCRKDEEPVPVNPYNGRSFAIFNQEKSYGLLTDIDGNMYKTITIGTQTWMAENMRTTRYRNGEAIPQVKNDTAWSGLFTGGYCNFGHTEDFDTIATFGRLYNWHAVNDSRNLAPQGWHVATDEDWGILEEFLGGAGVAGGKMKEKERPHWVFPDPNATNESGFTAIPAGMRNIPDGTFHLSCNFWSSTQADNCSAWDRYLVIGNDGCLRYNPNRNYGFSVRCVKD